MIFRTSFSLCFIWMTSFQRSKGVQHFRKPREKLGQVLGALVLDPHDEAAFAEDEVIEVGVSFALIVPDLLQAVSGLQSPIVLMAAPGAPLPGPPLRHGGEQIAGDGDLQMGDVSQGAAGLKTRLDSHCW